MDTPLNNHPVFAPDQVLTNKSLNQAVGYLGQQERFTRKKTIGHGIICGLNFLYEKTFIGSVDDYAIRLTPGEGLSTDGFLMQLPAENNLVFRYAKKYALPPNLVADDGLANPDTVESTNRPNTRKKINAGTVEKLGEILNTAYELLPDEAISKDVPYVPVTEILGKQLAFQFFLYLEITDSKNENCAPEDCDEKGRTRTFRIVPLVAPGAKFETQAYQGVSETPVRGYRMMDYESQYSFSNLFDSYREIIKSNIKIYQPVLTRLVARFSANTVYRSLSGKKLQEKLDELNTVRAGYKIQYVYNFLADLELAINELIQHLNCARVTTCNFSSIRYPRTLVLGDFISNDEFTDPVRYRFVAAPSVQEDEQHKATGFKMYARIGYMLEAHLAWLDGGNKEQEPNVVISPSRSAPSLLGSRTIPYYYDIPATGLTPAAFAAYWNAGCCNSPVLPGIYGYHAFASGDIKAAHEHLRYYINEYNFFRVEGHIGMNVDKAEEIVTGLINTHNLPFRTFRLPIKRTPVKAAAGDKETDKKQATARANMNKLAGMTTPKVPVPDNILRVSFKDLSGYMKKFIGVGDDGGIDTTPGGGTINYTPEHFRINAERVNTNPKILIIRDQIISNQRTVVLKVIGTDFADRAGNEVFAGEIYKLQVIYGRNYDVLENIKEEIPEVGGVTKEAAAGEKALPATKAAAKAKAANTKDFDPRASLTRFVQPVPYSLPEVTVIADDGDTPGKIATKLAGLILAQKSLGLRVAAGMADAVAKGDEIHIILNRPANPDYLYSVSPSVKPVQSELVHYLSVEYVGKGTLVSPVIISICYNDKIKDSISEVRMLAGTRLVNFPKDVKPYLLLPRMYVIGGVKPLITGTGGGPVDGEYNTWPFDANGNLSFRTFKGAEHLGGVYRGGAFIFLTEGVNDADDETVVGDIALPWDLEFINLSRAIALKFNRKPWVQGLNLWETYTPEDTK